MMDGVGAASGDDASLTDGLAELRVAAHVLVQLGSELVTDADQALLECVKNAYDADSPGCRIEIETAERGVRTEDGTLGSLGRFVQPFETVQAMIVDVDGNPVDGLGKEPGELVRRELAYEGRITIADSGIGLTPLQLRENWLVISRSAKRGGDGTPKPKTPRGRTPLGDKGLGRLGSMKLGDVLLVETATAADGPVSSAQFRWTDSETAATVDEIPVSIRSRANEEGFRGTRVSILGLRDLAEWRRPNRVLEIASSLAKLVSPFEATSTFPVSVSLDGAAHDLQSVTDELLGHAVARFDFRYAPTFPGGPNVLMAEARLSRRLLAPRRSEEQKRRTDAVFDRDGGKGFVASLATNRRMKGYDARRMPTDGKWFIELDRAYGAERLLRTEGGSTVDPGPFEGSFYFFHLVNEAEDALGTVSGTGMNKALVKNLSGVSILRDGFRVRSQGDWLELSSGMTSGSTYDLRPDNTIGWFALTGEHNYMLVEKSDREGFVEDAAYRGFLEAARLCRSFANGVLTDVRRSVDDYGRKILDSEVPSDGRSEPLPALGRRIEAMALTQSTADRVARQLAVDIQGIEDGDNLDGARLLDLVKTAATEIGEAVATMGGATDATALIERLGRDVAEDRERAAALLESASVGLSARGLTHELRTHLTEIRQRVTSIERAYASGASPDAHYRAIKRSCSAIAQAASLIDPLLPRSRAVKDTFGLVEFATRYFADRSSVFGRASVRTEVTGADLMVRMNRPRLLQVLDNLARNSLFWLRRGGVTQERSYVRFDVGETGFAFSDGGPGVDPHVEETLFDLFVTTKGQDDGGQGLGLFLASELLQLDGCGLMLTQDRNDDGRRYRFAVDLGAVLARG